VASTTPAKTKVLFLCTGNSCRSQMAEAILRHYAGDRFAAFSAGMDPKPIHPLTLRVLEEKGISTAGLYSKDSREYLGREHFQYLVIVCDKASQTCPRIWPGVTHRVSLVFDDPAESAGTEEERQAKFREVRDQIEAGVMSWVWSIEAEALAAGNRGRP
jgi:arsenate reductase